MKLCCVLLCLGALCAHAADVAFVIPHTHWEGAVFKTREDYLEMGLPNIEKALYLLKKYPNYRFVLDQMCYVKPFLERYPTEVETVRTMLQEGRLQIAGGTDVMHDNNTPSGESIVRQYLLGKTYFRDKLNYDVTTGWGLDTFGHNAQMPQILKLAGMKSYWFQRGVPKADTPSEFLWQGIDGTKIPAFWLRSGYSVLVNMPANGDEFNGRLKTGFYSLKPFTKAHEVVLFAGADVSEPEENLVVGLERWNHASEQPFAAKFALPIDYETAVAERPAVERPTIEGELNPVFQGVYSTRIEVKQAIRNMERLLTTAEKLDVLASVIAKAPSQREAIEQAWEPVLFNQTHDLTSGVMTDRVYEDSMQRYAHAELLANDLIREKLETILARVNTAGKGVPVAVFNTLGWPRTDVAELDIPFSDAGVRTFALLDAAGESVPIQMSEILRNEDGGMRQAHVTFVARDIPALGFAVYHAVANMAPAPGPATLPSRDTTRDDSGTIENEFYRASFNLWNGAMTSLVLKEDNNWEVLAGAGNIVAREFDGGDFWELYGTLNGGRFTAMTKEIPAPRPAYTQWSSDFVGGTGSTGAGPVFSEFHITHPFGKNQFSTRVRIYRGIRRVEVATTLINEEEFVRYRASFPTTIQNGKRHDEIPFGAIERPQRQEFPAQNWMDYSDSSHGLALLNQGIPGNNVADGNLLLSLMRSTRLISYGYQGGYEPGNGSDSALGIGNKYTLHYALMPHKGDWRAAATWRSGLEFNNPLIARTAAAHAGDTPARWGLFELSDANVVTSAVKAGKDGSVVIRFYEPSGKAVNNVTVTWHAPVSKVNEANLMEDTGAAVTAQRDSFMFDLRPYEIKTFQLKVR